MDCQSERSGTIKNSRYLTVIKGLSRSVESTYYKSEGKQIPIKWSAPVCSHKIFPPKNSRKSIYKAKALPNQMFGALE